MNTPTFKVLNTKVNVSLVPFAKLAIVHVFVVVLYTPFEATTPVKFNPCGSISLTVTFVAFVAFLALLTAIVKVISSPKRTMLSETLFVTLISTIGSTWNMF